MTAGPLVAVTGGTGVVGTAVLRRLVASGVAVRALSRSATTDGAVAGAGAEPVRGDITDPASLAALLRGAEVVYHIAGLNQLCPRDPSALFRVNVDGTRAVIGAARQAGARRVVYTSSAAAIGERPGTVGTETSPHRGWYLSHYERSKHLAEQAAFSETGGIEVVAVNPSSVQGPGRATGTGKLILDLLNERLPGLVDTRLSIVDIEDCARGHLLAAERGVPGERYLLNSFTLGMRQAVDLLAEAVGRPLRPRFLPGWLAAAGGTLVEVGAWAFRRDPPVCREMVRTLRHGHAYDGSKAVRDLGLSYTTAEDLLGRLVRWFSQQGLLDR